MQSSAPPNTPISANISAPGMGEQHESSPNGPGGKVVVVVVLVVEVEVVLVVLVVEVEVVLVVEVLVVEVVVVDAHGPSAGGSIQIGVIRPKGSRHGVKYGPTGWSVDGVKVRIGGHAALQGTKKVLARL